MDPQTTSTFIDNVMTLKIHLSITGQTHKTIDVHFFFTITLTVKLFALAHCCITKIINSRVCLLIDDNN